MKKFAISVNITAHNEGLLLYKTLKSVESMCLYFKSKIDEEIEVNLSLDNPDQETKRIAREFKVQNNKINIYEVNFKDLADSRNNLIKQSTGDYLVFIDGDDLFSGNYLYKAYTQALESLDKNFVLSPEYLVSFGEHNYIVRKLDFNSSSFKIINCFETNYFISQSFAPKEVFNRLSFRPNKYGYGMEDWDWNNTAIFNGIKFYNVPNTIFFYRRKKNSMITNQVATKSALRPNQLFEPRNFAQYPSYLINNTNIKTNSSSKLKTRIKNIIKLGTFGSETASIYLKDQYLAHKKIINSLKDSGEKLDSVTPLETLRLSKETMNQWSDINRIEPLIRPSKDKLNSMVVGYYPEVSNTSLLYHEMCIGYVKKGGSYRHLVVVPHLIKGGADLAALKLVKALSELNKEDRVLVISTMNVKSLWAERLEEFKNVDYVNPYSIFDGISSEDIELILLKVIQHWSISYLHIINSEAAYKLLINYGKIIEKSIKVFLHTYAFDMDSEGYIYNYIANGLIDTYPRVNKFITDSETYRNELIKINGFEPNKIIKLDLPVDNMLRPVKRAQKTGKILWAGRISDAKLVETAVDIGKKLQHENIELHFYGHLDNEYKENNKFLNMIKDYKNISYHGSFDSFREIPIQEYDALLFTSKNEGLPNIVLEAIATNTFIVASNVGAINEVIKNGKNGVLVNDIYNIGSYLNELKKFYKSEKTKSEQLLLINQGVMKKRTFSNYVNEVKKLIN